MYTYTRFSERYYVLRTYIRGIEKLNDNQIALQQQTQRTNSAPLTGRYNNNLAAVEYLPTVGPRRRKQIKKEE